MVKVTKTYYRRRGYRRFYRRYTRRINRKMYNSIKLNYMKAKIDFEFSLEVNDLNENKYWFKEYGGGSRTAQALDVLDKINDLEEYKLYNSLFNEVKLLGVAVQCVPFNTALNRNAEPVLFYCTYRQGNGLTTPIILNPMSNTNRYFKNWDRKWVPSNQEQAVINQGRDLDFFISTNSKSSTNRANSPGWTVHICAYVQFRKNLSL